MKVVSKNKKLHKSTTVIIAILLSVLSPLFLALILGGYAADKAVSLIKIK